MKRMNIRMVGCLLAALLATSCSKKVKDAVASEGTATEMGIPADLLPRVTARRAEIPQVSGRISLKLAMGEQQVSASGDLKMKRNGIIQITLQALGLITVGRLEFTPTDMMVMDNLNKRFVRVPYKEVPYLRDNGLDFYAFQAVLWNELYVPGQKSDEAPKASSFQAHREGSDITLTCPSRQLVLDFLVNPIGQLLKTTVHTSANRQFACEYQGWGKLGDKAFPNKYRATVGQGTQHIEVQMSVSKLRVDENWKGNPTRVDTKKFEQLTLQQVWAAVMKASAGR